MTVKELVDKLTKMVEKDEIWHKSEVVCIDDTRGTISYPEEIYVNQNGMLAIRTLGDELFG